MTKAKKARNLNQALLIFVKNPELGKVKTRLARDVGAQTALSIYKRLLDHTRDIAIKVNATKYLFYSDHITNDQWSEDDFTKRVQSKGNLGERMRSALDEVLENHESAIIIGSDCAQLSSDIISGAFKALAFHDVVIGPAIDGGYYLIGMNQVHTSLFEDIKWSTSDVYQSTLGQAEKLHLLIAKMPTLSDIDTEANWNQYGLE